MDIHESFNAIGDRWAVLYLQNWVQSEYWCCTFGRTFASHISQHTYIFYAVKELWRHLPPGGCNQKIGEVLFVPRLHNPRYLAHYGMRDNAQIEEEFKKRGS